MAAVEPKVFKEVNCLDHATFLEMSQVGLYIFKFYKNSKPVYVIIDDRIPCIQSGNGQPIPVFAKCENKNLFWVSLIEKAYAKLHHRYFALSGGSTKEALIDLTGNLIEECFIDNGDQMTKSNLLFNSLRVLCTSNCLVGAKLDMGMFPVMKGSTKEKYYAEAQGEGIHSRYMYSVLDARDITVPDQDGNKQQYQLIRLKDPWAGSKEYKGPCSDFDINFWTDPVKSAFNTRNRLEENEEEEVDVETTARFIHSWNNTNDGVFAIKLQDFMRLFNHLTICRKTDDSWFEA